MSKLASSSSYADYKYPDADGAVPGMGEGGRGSGGGGGDDGDGDGGEQEQPSYTSSALADKVVSFLSGFRDANDDHKYVTMIDQMMAKNVPYIVVDYNDLISERDLGLMFVDSPDVILDAFSRAIKEVLQVRFYEYAELIGDEIRARIINYPMERSLRKINSEAIATMTSVSGMVVRASVVNPLAKELTYMCKDGHETHITDIKGMDVKGPAICDDPECKLRDFELKPESSKFIDIQILRLQELPEDLPPGQLPYYIDVMIKQDLVDYARPGDRIVLTGIVRVEQEQVTGISKSRSGLYRLRIEGNNIEFLGGRSKARKGEREEISPDDEKTIKALTQDPDIYDRLIESFAPHIKGHQIIKESILLLMVGSSQRVRDDGSKIRGDINVFLVGDPGTAKSEMLKFCSRIAPRGLYTSGRGSTAAGLTAAVVPDKTGIMMLEAGAVVLGDQGMVAIDEFDKMKSEDRSALHEVMEQQSASIAKGGIVATLNARTSILAAANPMFGKYDPFRNITENINLPIPLLSRFDLIFVVRDIPSKEEDTAIARHVIKLHTMTGVDTQHLIDADLLTKYLLYAKRIDPAMTREAENKIIDYYVQMRNITQENMTPVTPRQLEGIIRLATARARLLMKGLVEEEDADRAIYLLQNMLEDAGVDVNTGQVDIGVLQGKPRSEVSKLQLFMDILKRMEGDKKEPVEEGAFIKELEGTEKFGSDDARRYIRKLQNEGVIYESRPGYYNKS